MHEFLNELERFIVLVQNMPRFKGQTQALRSLRRLSRMSVFS